MIRAVVFDLDGTLYRSRVIERQFAEAAYFTLAKAKRIGLGPARRLVEARRSRLSKQRGYRVPYTHTLRSFGVPIEYWHRQNIEFFDPRHFLKRNAPLVKILKRLSRDYRLAVVTNNNRVQTERVLEAVGIRRFFRVIQSFTDSSCLKPDPKVFAQVARRLRVKPRECLSVGDRIDTDLIPAAKSGMRVFHVASPRGINRLARSKTLLA